MTDRFDTENEFGAGTVLSWASLLETNTREQAEMTSRSRVLAGHLALMPDAHLGMGATVGSVLRTAGAIIPAAVGVDIGCGMIAVRTDLKRDALDLDACRRILGCIRENVPSGFGRGNITPVPEWADFVTRRGYSPTVMLDANLIGRAAQQFCSLGDGNHFAEVAEDADGTVWAIVHSGSRGVGNVLAQRHIKIAQAYCEANDLTIEHVDLAYLVAGTAEFEAYIADMLWAQGYAFWQRDAMMTRVLAAVATEAEFSEQERINCHHNYSEPLADGLWLTRKGAIDASLGRPGIIPGSMGDATYVVHGLGNADSYNSSPHGAGRVLSRGGARRELDVDAFRAQMVGKTWQDRNADDLIDEAPNAYKPIAMVMQDAASLVEPVAVLRQFINYKGIGQQRRKKRALVAVVAEAVLEDAG